MLHGINEYLDPWQFLFVAQIQGRNQTAMMVLFDIIVVVNAGSNKDQKERLARKVLVKNARMVPSDGMLTVVLNFLYENLREGRHFKEISWIVLTEGTTRLRQENSEFAHPTRRCWRENSKRIHRESCWLEEWRDKVKKTAGLQTLQEDARGKTLREFIMNRADWRNDETKTRKPRVCTPVIHARKALKRWLRQSAHGFVVVAGKRVHAQRHAVLLSGSNFLIIFFST